MARAGVEASRRGGVGGGSVGGGGGLGSAADAGFLGAGSGLGRAGGGSVAAHELALAAASGRNPCAFHVRCAIVASTFTTSSASAMRAVFLRLVSAILACGVAGGGRSSNAAASTLEEIGMIDCR